MEEIIEQSWLQIPLKAFESVEVIIERNRNHPVIRLGVDYGRPAQSHKEKKISTRTVWLRRKEGLRLRRRSLSASMAINS